MKMEGKLRKSASRRNMRIALWRRAGIVRPMHPREKASLFHALGQLVRTGTPFPKAIGKLALLSRGPARASLARIQAALDRGASVGDSLLAGAPLVSALEACVFSASDRAGRLDHGLDQASQYHAAIAEARSRTRARLAYPAFVLHFALLVLPLPTLFAENGGLGPFLKAVGLAVGALWLSIFTVAALVRILLAAAEKTAAADSLLRAIPLFGKLRRDFALGRFCSAYHMQLDAGVNVLASLEASGAASGSALLRDAVASAMPEVRSGGQVGPALEKTRAFPEPFIRAFTVGEHTGELDRELLRIGEEYRNSAIRGLETIAEWVPRLIYVAILLYIGWRIISFYTGRMKELQNVLEQ
jgi:type II secretory pathway component PulF